jgi:hypothetical protein
MADEPQPKRAGRRRRGEPAQRSVHVSLPDSIYDRSYQIARAHKLTVPGLLRRAFLRHPLVRDPEPR